MSSDLNIVLHRLKVLRETLLNEANLGTDYQYWNLRVEMVDEITNYINKKNLKSLKQYEMENARKFESLRINGKPNGIECPNCGEELCDSNCRCMFSTFPPQVDTICNSCGYTGSRTA